MSLNTRDVTLHCSEYKSHLQCVYKPILNITQVIYRLDLQFRELGASVYGLRCWDNKLVQYVK